jgi:hypothetical protein
VQTAHAYLILHGRDGWDAQDSGHLKEELGTPNDALGLPYSREERGLEVYDDDQGLVVLGEPRCHGLQCNRKSGVMQAASA